MTGKTIIYVDMDHVLCDYEAGYARHQARYPDLKYPQSQPGMYLELEPMDGALETYRWLHGRQDTAVFILSAPSVMNPHSYSEKRLWVERHLGMDIADNLILSSHKGLNRGDFLIDDNVTGKGQENFVGELIQFGSPDFPDWVTVHRYFEKVLTADREIRALSRR